MTFKWYLEFVLEREGVLATDTLFRLKHAGCGLVTETGEIMDIWKKWAMYDKEVDVVDLAGELGDLMWYVGIGMNAVGLNPTQVPLEMLVHGLPMRDVKKEEALFEASAALSEIAARFVNIPRRQNLRRSQSEIIGLIKSAIEHVMYIGRAFDLTLSMIMASNVAKLSMRDPSNGPRTGKRPEPDLPAERAAIEAIIAI